MANITPVDNWSDIPQIEQTDYVLGGEGQIANQQAQALANRTENLKNTVTSNKTTQDNKNDSIDAAINDLNTNKVNKSDIVNNATTTASGKVLDGRMGKTLNDIITSNYNTLNTNKVNKSDVVNNYTTTTAGKVLDARVAVSLKTLIDGKQPSGSYVLTSNIVNNATTTVSGKVLDGRMGKTLNDAIVSNYNTLNTNKVNKSDIADNLTTNNASKVLSAKQGYILKGLIDTANTNINLKINKSDIADNLTTDSSTKVLSAKQGKLLNEKLLSSVPIGTVLPYFGTDSTLPSTFKACNGQTLTKASYTELFNVFLSSGMVSSSATAFTLPDLRHKYLKGSTRNDSSGYIGRTLQERLPDIKGGVSISQLHWSDSQLLAAGGAVRFIGGDGRGLIADGGSAAIQLKKGYFSASTSNSVYNDSIQQGQTAYNSIVPYSCNVNWIIRVK